MANFFGIHDFLEHVCRFVVSCVPEAGDGDGQDVHSTCFVRAVFDSQPGSQRVRGLFGRFPQSVVFFQITVFGTHVFQPLLEQAEVPGFVFCDGHEVVVERLGHLVFPSEPRHSVPREIYGPAFDVHESMHDGASRSEASCLSTSLERVRLHHAHTCVSTRTFRRSFFIRFSFRSFLVQRSVSPRTGEFLRETRLLVRIRASQHSPSRRSYGATFRFHRRRTHRGTAAASSWSRSMVARV
mmetsp:Transcript_5839/g.36209  ORF Transcript_5839/g.36209 Transcript_5839/m.36209 type:complete len:240 (+) Transcript_5839:1775-2494(+)